MIFKSHYAPLCRYAQQFVPDYDTAQELTQKVFVSMWENQTELDANRAPGAYLHTAVRNRCLNYIRDQKKYRSHFLDIECASEIPTNFDLDDQEELRRRIAKAMDALPDKCRQVFEMSRQQDLKYREIAEALDISIKTVEVHMSKALRILREHLGMGAFVSFFMHLY